MAKAQKVTKKTRKSSGRMASKGFFNPIDVHVGQRIRQRRTLLGLSQTTLGDAIGLTFQQIQKYERGANRVSSSRMFDIAKVLDVTIAYFYEDMTAKTASNSPAVLAGVSEDDLPEIDFAKDPMAKRETLEFVRAYYKIPETSARKQLASLIKVLSKTAED
jgi:transcriptional regulator with XRE-family HTH domain